MKLCPIGASNPIMSEYQYKYGAGHSWDEHNVIQPLLVLATHDGFAPAKEIILHKNAVERGLMKLDLFGNVEFTDDGEKVLDEYLQFMHRFTFHCST